MRKIPLVAAILLSFSSLHAAIVTKNVEYQSGKTTMKGYLTHKIGKTTKKGPAVLVVHEWWGQNDYARRRAEMLAQLGYTALAVDMYGDGKQAAHPQDAGAFSKAVFTNFAEGQARFNAALEFLKKQPTVDPDRIAAIGYCFGGAVVLNMARVGAPLRGVASFHGSLFAVQPAKVGKVKAKVLVCTGADDMMVTEDQVEAFRKEMETAGVDHKIVSYVGAKHSFTNPDADKKAVEFNLPLAYDKKADRRSWKELKKFLKDVLR